LLASVKTRLTSVAIRIRIRIRICDPDRHQNLIICSVAHYQQFLIILCKLVHKSLRKVANRQTNKQTDNKITYPPSQRYNYIDYIICICVFDCLL